MCALNKINEVMAYESDDLIDELLKKELGFKGL
jgi:beta-glucosidase-like glycosyl hydrolase